MTCQFLYRIGLGDVDRVKKDICCSEIFFYSCYVVWLLHDLCIGTHMASSRKLKMILRDCFIHRLHYYLSSSFRQKNWCGVVVGIYGALVTEADSSRDANDFRDSRVFLAWQQQGTLKQMNFMMFRAT